MRHCHYCGKFFRPNPRLGNRQKSCGKEECKRKRKKESQKNWVSKNSGYFKNRYNETRAWREKNKGYQKEWRKKKREIQDSISSGSPIRTLSILVPDKVLKGKIQDSIRLVRQCSCGLWLTGTDREIQDSIGII